MEKTIITIVTRMEETLGEVKGDVKNIAKRMDIANGRLAKNELEIEKLKDQHEAICHQLEDLQKQNIEDEGAIKQKLNEFEPAIGVLNIMKSNWKIVLFIIGAFIAFDTVYDIVQEHFLR